MPPENERQIEIDLSDLGLRAPLTSLDDLATAASYVYERFVPYADEGWEWVGQPGLPTFDCWTYQMRDGELVVAGARLPVRRAAGATSQPRANPSHGVSAYRTRQLTQTPWTAEPGSKIWRPFTQAAPPAG
jgi:hypothetical protein